jgi:8-oxo-dGTP diphosphatase
MAGSRKRAGRKRPYQPQVRAAGGLIWHHAESGRGVEVVVIHRPDHDDWSFPKGKLGKGETSEDAAVREVEEETGLVCVRRAEIEPARYLDSKGRRKEVRYWLMEPVDVRPWSPNDEVDRRVWVPVAEAATLLTYDHDRALLESFARGVEQHDPYA